MQEWTIVLTLLGISIGVILLVVCLCHRFGGWSAIYLYIAGNREETAQLTKNGHFGENGYILNSESDIALDVSGNYKHYDNVGNDLKLVQETDTIETKDYDLSSPPSVRQLDMPAQSINEEGDQEDIIFLEKNHMPPLKRAISCDSISSNTSVLAEALESPHVCGEIELGLEYDSETEDLIVIINRARDLVGPNPSSVVDCYIKVFLLPDRSTNMQTRVQRKTTNTIFRERFLFGVDENELNQRSLLCAVYTCDKYTNSMIGEAEIKLSDISLQQPHIGWFPVVDFNQGPAELGDILFSLSYLPTAERLTVVVVKGRNLRWKKTTFSSDFNPFVKVYLLQNGKKFAKKKTTVKKDERNPIFNEAMMFSVPAHALQNLQLRVTIADFQEAGKAPAVGHVFIGPFCKGKSLSHWNQMMSSLRKPVAMWHPLRRSSDF